MKLNWAKSIILAFAAFMAFIFYFVIRVQTNPGYNNELVVEEYYKHDAHFGDELSREQNVADLAQKPTITENNQNISIVFPKKIFSDTIKGKVSLYRPSAKKLDFELPFSLSDSTLLIPKRDFADGNWGITLNWSYAGKAYEMKQKIYIR